MRYKQEYEKMLDKYAKLLNFAYGCVAELKKFPDTTNNEGIKRDEELRNLLKDN
jgi:hypothetical protein